MSITTPFDYQRKGALGIEKKYVEEFGGVRCLLAWEMGLGKSLTSFLWSYWNKEERPAIVLCPAGLKENWAREAAVHFGMRSEVLEGTRPGKGGFRSNKKLLIVNYDILGQRRAVNAGPGWIDWLRNLDPKLIIIDECQYVSNRSAKRTKYTKELCKGVPNVIALSGTPLTNRPAELWPTLNILRPDRFPFFRPYGNRFCAPRRTPWRMEYKGAVRLPELHKTLRKTVMLRLLKKEVLHELPDKRRIVLPLEITDRKQYQKAVHSFLRWLSEHNPAKAKKASRSEQVTKIGYLKRLAAELKVRSVFEWIDNFLAGTDEKLILFGVHHNLIDQLHSRYKKNSVVITGKVPVKKRLGIVDQFQNNPKTRILIGNIKAAGVGLNMTAATTVAFFELGWTPGEHTQAEDRAHRIGQTKGVTVYYLVASGTIEEKLCEILQKKSEVLAATLDGKGKGDRMDVYDQLERELRKAA